MCIMATAHFHIFLYAILVRQPTLQGGGRGGEGRGGEGRGGEGRGGEGRGGEGRGGEGRGGEGRGGEGRGGEGRGGEGRRLCIYQKFPLYRVKWQFPILSQNSCSMIV